MPIVAYDHLVVRCNDIDAGVATYDGFGLELREPASSRMGQTCQSTQRRVPLRSKIGSWSALAL